MVRKIKKIVTGQTQYDGAGVKLVRVISKPDVKDFDPFLMLDAFDSDNPEDYVKGFPWHPHRGIETITYLIEGDIEHGDSLGNVGSIKNGSCQWMTSGKGILHYEMPKACKRMLGVQLWLNMPKNNKMSEPKYHDVKPETIKRIDGEGYTVGIISGEFAVQQGATKGEYLDIIFMDIEMEENSEFKYSLNPEYNMFVYIIEGEGYFDESKESLQTLKRAVLFGEGEDFYASTKNSKMRFLLLAGKPLEEPVAWGGPIVMNTQEELNKAFYEIEKGEFIK